MALSVGGAIAATPADQLIIGESMNNILSLDPGAETGRESVEIDANVYDFLIEMDGVTPGKMLPGLAKSWDVATDGTITLHLRDGVKFHSGNPVTAQDAVWSMVRVLKHNLNQSTDWKNYGFTADNIDKVVTAPDDHTVVIKPPQPTDPKLLLFTLASNCAGAVVDEKTAMAHEKDGDFGNGWLTTHDAGSGPFTLQNWQANNIVILSRFDAYWQKPALVKRVVFRHMPESQAQRLALQHGDIDIAKNLSVPDIKALQADKDVQIQSSPDGNVYYLAANLKKPKFADKNVRLALRYLIDYKGINDTIMPFYGVLHQRPIDNGLMGDLPDPGYVLDVAKAKDYLAKAGFPDGFDTTIRVLPDSPFIGIATSIQSTLAQAGIKAQILTGNGDQTYGSMRDRSFDLVVGRGGGGTIPHPHSNLLSQIFNPDNSDAAKMISSLAWRTSFQDKDLNKAINDALLEKDPKKQEQMYEEIQQQYEADVPALQPISQAVNTVAYQAAVQNYHYSPAWTTRFREVSKTK